MIFCQIMGKNDRPLAIFTKDTRIWDRPEPVAYLFFNPNPQLVFHWDSRVPDRQVEAHRPQLESSPDWDPA